VIERTTAGGETVYVADEEERVGSEGPFNVVYRDADGECRWGYLCVACDSLDTMLQSIKWVSTVPHLYTPFYTQTRSIRRGEAEGGSQRAIPNYL
jgi:hypothetical protein